MAEIIIRPHKRPRDRWMPTKGRAVNRARLMVTAAFVMRATPGFLLSFADIIGMPSGLHVSLAVAAAAMGLDIAPMLAGGLAAVLLRWMSGVDARWVQLISLGMVAASTPFLRDKGTLWVMGAAGLAMLPQLITAFGSATAAELLLYWGAAAVSILSTPMLARAIKALRGSRSITSVEERLAVGYAAALCICGGARLLLPGLNAGMLLAAGLTLALAYVLGASVGAVAGMMAGVMLALQGLSLMLGIALAVGGFLAGIVNSLGRRPATCAAFAMGSLLTMLLSGTTGMGCGGAVLTACLAAGILPERRITRLQEFLRRFLPDAPVPGDAFSAAALSAWEQTVAALARAVPSPKDAAEPRNGAWWARSLCQGCPEEERCGCLSTDMGCTKAEAVWAYRNARDDVWQGALEQLRGMGCQRLYYLMDAMNALRREDALSQRVIRQSEAQREMLITHLIAISGAARRFAQLSSSASWWDEQTAKEIRRLLDERAYPATLSYVRRVQGHAQACFLLQQLTNARKQAEELSLLIACVVEAPMQLASVDGVRILLTERPPLSATVGVALAALADDDPCGDTIWSGSLQDGRFLVALSDGMGHGGRAALSSRQTVELLRLCLDAGYTRQQTLTAVNGMLLLGGGGERFATADVLTIDLWKGDAALDKLGAAASWLYQQGLLSRLDGDALPLGILEDVDQDGSMLRLSEGDVVILLSDGVEDAFDSIAALEAAIMSSLEAVSPEAAAQELLDAAHEAAQERRDDQSAVVVSISRSTGR